jgi:hypothetical protein
MRTMQWVTKPKPRRRSATMANRRNGFLARVWDFFRIEDPYRIPSSSILRGSGGKLLPARVKVPRTVKPHRKHR